MTNRAKVLNWLFTTEQELYEDLKFFEMEERYGDMADLEKKITEIKDAIAFIQTTTELDLIHTHMNGEFDLICLQLKDKSTKYESEVVEKYDDAMTFNNWNELIQETECKDITDEFDISEIIDKVNIVRSVEDILLNGAENQYYLTELN